jgi:hypothetical protein
MGDKEKKVINRILKNIDPDWERYFRINAGEAWTGETMTHKGSFLVLKNPRRFHGAPDGFPDMIGWETVEITEEMVGKKIAVFKAIEVKATGRLSKAQERFQAVLERMGGIFEVAK